MRGSFFFISIFILFALYASFSRGAWLGAAAAGLVMVIFFPRRWSLGLVVGLGGLVVGLLELRRKKEQGS